MAKTHLTSGERLRIYEAVFRLNRSFHLIVSRLSDLDKLRAFDSKILAELRALTQEMQVEINHHLLERLGSVEDKDWHSFGRVRAKRGLPELPESTASRDRLPKVPKLKGRGRLAANLREKREF